MKNIALVVLAFGLVGAALFWWTRDQEPSDITEEQAKALADKELTQFCLAEKVVCPDLAPQGQQPSPDPRFKWSYHFLNKTSDPWKKVIVHVGGKGEPSVEFMTMPPQEEPAAAPTESQPAPAEAAPAP